MTSPKYGIYTIFASVPTLKVATAFFNCCSIDVRRLKSGIGVSEHEVVNMLSSTLVNVFVWIDHSQLDLVTYGGVEANFSRW